MLHIDTCLLARGSTVSHHTETVVVLLLPFSFAMWLHFSASRAFLAVLHNLLDEELRGDTATVAFQRVTF